MSVDSIASAIQAYQASPLSGNSAASGVSAFAPAAGTGAKSANTLCGSLQGLSSDLQNVLLQLQSGGGKTSEAGSPTQATPGMHHHHHGHSQQASAHAASPAG